ncbi:hypothetical protein [Proteiniclasticum ruminis]|uniref:Uncharacterized protein n=1 Tax=Proteiniclasticum ruminis TaxID=398199 RepID=A0A1G8GIS1_9CLOT|nr:hypothetical protein [Proteiniclasticum ruminis]SDH94231.1 hypothetical protein SAMN05421804_101279 [Proteiniclasticum ruminis]
MRNKMLSDFLNIEETLEKTVTARNSSEYERIVRLSEILTGCPFTNRQLKEVETIWKASMNEQLCRQQPGVINSVFCTHRNVSEFVMENFLSVSFKGYDSIHYRFDDIFITGILVSKVLRKWEKELINMSSDTLRALFVYIELMRIIDSSHGLATEELTAPTELIKSVFECIDKNILGEEIPKVVDELKSVETYVKSIELDNINGYTFKFHLPISYDLDKFDIFKAIV